MNFISMSKKKKKKSIGKKIAKWSFSILLFLLIALISIPYLFKDKIVQMVSNTINNKVNAKVTFKETNLSLLKHFPLASLTVNDVVVANKAPFVGDTLFRAKELSLDLKITELFKKPDETLEIKEIYSSNGQVNIIFNKDGLGNYDIAKKKETTVNESSNSSFTFNINAYQLNNIDFNYVDRATKTKLSIDSIYHTGKGNFKEDIFNLDTKSTGFLSFSLDKTNFANRIKIALDAILEIDLKHAKYTFKKNTGYINQLPLAFDGFIQLLEESQLYNLHFKTPTSSFKNALALVPKQYSGNLETLQTKGSFDIEGILKGNLSETTIPSFLISINSKDAMFKYADLPKAVKNIAINAQIINKTGLVKDTYVAMRKLDFKIDEDAFSANGNIKHLTTNPKIDFSANGTINLENIAKVYPTLEKEFAGILTANVTTSFDMNAIEKKSYEKIKNSGTIAVTNFKYDSKDVANPFFIDRTKIAFNPKSIKLKEFKAKTGTSDVSVEGNIDNFYGFIFKNEVLKGNFNLNSNNFKISDFLTNSATEDDKDTTSSLKIPAFLDCKFSAKAKTVVYDNINLKNVSGNLYIHDETVDLKNLNSDVFGGNIAFSGAVTTKEKTPNFKMSLDLNQLNISESFSNLEMLSSIAPIANTIGGKINSKVNLSGSLKEDMTPNLTSISGDLFGKLVNPKLSANNSKVLSLLGNKLNFLDPKKLNLDGINAFFSFKNGEVTVKPIPLTYKDIKIEVGGKHGFDNAMNYNITFDVPVKYLGSEVTGLLAKLTPKDAANIKTIPVKGVLGGSFSNPTFSSNLKDATSSLVKDLIEKQKNSLLNKGKNKLLDLIGSKKDSTKKADVKDKVKDVLGGLFGKKKKDNKKKN